MTVAFCHGLAVEEKVERYSTRQRRPAEDCEANDKFKPMFLGVCWLVQVKTGTGAIQVGWRRGL